MSHEIVTTPTWAKLTAAGMIVSATLTGCTVGQSSPDHNSSASTQVGPETTPPAYIPPACETVATPTDISVAAQLMAEPGNKYLEFTPMPYPARQAGIHEVVTTSAKEYGLTVYDGRNQADAWDAKVNSKHPPSFQAVFSVVHNYMEKLGVDLELGRPNDPNYDYGSRPPTAAELNTRGAKNDLIDTMTAFSTVPKEYLELAGLKHIYLVAGTNKTAEGYTDASNSHNDAYYKDIKEADGPDVDLHELSHMVDARECGGDIENDPTWTALNRGIDVYTANPNDTKHLSYYDKYINDKQSYLNKEIAAEMNHQKKQYCQTVAADNAEAKDVITYSNYHTTAAEDKAEIMKNIPYDYGWADITSKRFPYLYGKFRLELARLYHIAPRLARYFAAVSDRTDNILDPNAPRC